MLTAQSGTKETGNKQTWAQGNKDGKDDQEEGLMLKA